jgi:nicotinate-nucleotide pyrophosphorylase (carboxylating)
MKPPQGRDMDRFVSVRVDRALGALEEDLFLGDITTEAVLQKDPLVIGKVVACETGIVAGLEEACSILGGKNCVVEVTEGGAVKKGQVVIVVTTRASSLLAKIRTALNYLSYLSGLATNARRLQKKFGRARIAALRKTHPGMGVSEKRALQIGGVMPHRVNLGDGILIKKEHLTLLCWELTVSRPEAAREAVRLAKEYVKRCRLRRVFVEIEVEDEQTALEAARARPDAILLDNMAPKRVAQVVKSIRRLNKQVVIESSGGINERNARKYLRAGADLVSGSFVFETHPVGFKLVLGA